MALPKFWIREDVYYTYKCMKCERETGEANIVKSPRVPALLPGSFASAEAAAHITLQRGFSCRLRGNSPSDAEVRDVLASVPTGAGV